MALTKPHGNTGKVRSQSVADARARSLREPFISQRPPPASEPAWHPKPSAWAPLPGTTPVRLLDVTGCRWQVSTEGPAMFCNAERAGGSWCPTHDKLSRPKAIEVKK